MININIFSLWKFHLTNPALTGKKVYLRCLENNIFTSVVLLYMYVYLPMDVILMVFWMKFYNYTIEVIKISNNNLMIVIFTLKSILKKIQ